MTDHSNKPLLPESTLEAGAAIAAMSEPARTDVLASLVVRASAGVDGDSYGEDRAADLFLAARVDPVTVLREDPFKTSPSIAASVQYDRLMCPHNYRSFCAEYPVDQPLDPAELTPYVGLMEGGPGVSSWHAPGGSPDDILALAEERAEEGLSLQTIWDLRTGKPAVLDFVIALTVHVRAFSADHAHQHVVDLVADLDDEVVRDLDTTPAVHRLHLAGPFHGPGRDDIADVESIPAVWHSGHRAAFLTPADADIARRLASTHKIG